MAPKALIQGLVAGGLSLASGLAVALIPEPARAQVVIEVGVQAPRADIERYPRTWYNDREVYWVNGRWYYRRGPSWYYYRIEPAPLHHHRVIVLERPPHRHRAHYKSRHEHHRHKHHRRAHHREHRPERRHVVVID